MTLQDDRQDDVLDQISRKVWELIQNIVKGSVNLERVLTLLRPIVDDIPQPHDEGCSHGTYLLESRWSWDNSHNEIATISLEKCDSDIAFEELLNPLAPHDKKVRLLDMLKRIYTAQIPQHGGHKMRRLYRIIDTTHFGYDPDCGLNGTLQKDMVDLHLILKPLFDFNSEGQPIPCKITR